MRNEKLYGVPAAAQGVVNAITLSFLHSNRVKIKIKTISRSHAAKLEFSETNWLDILFSHMLQSIGTRP